MARASFEYDEVGNTFYYVLVSFYAIILLPATYIYFPIGKEEEPVHIVNDHECQCDGCDKKRKMKAANKPWKRTKKIITIAILVVAWAIFAMIVKKTTEIEQTHKDYDPYQILGLDQGADDKSIKKAYRDLSKVHHPDRGGAPEFFDKIAKAYQALTDKEAKENWEKYGNPDGPQATTFGIALPKWLISKEYGLWVLAFYGLVFMVILPIVVGMWWYNSIKYSADKVLLDTTRLYFYFIQKTPRLEMGRMLAIFSGSFEFNRAYNKTIVERESDEVELPRLMRYLPGINDKARENPLGYPYAIKARTLIHAYLSRQPLESVNGALDQDQSYIVSRALRLVEEMMSCAQNLMVYNHAKVPIETIEMFMKLQPMFVQALWQKNSPLLQLPHITDYSLQHLRKQKISSCHDLAVMSAEKRRMVLRSLSDEEYRNVMVVLSMMPRLQIEAKAVVEGEDDEHQISAGCTATLKVTLKRTRLIDPQEAGIVDQHKPYPDNDDDDEAEENDGEEGVVEEEKEVKKARKPWEKNKPKSKKGGKKKAKKPLKKAAAPVTEPEPEEEKKKESDVSDEESDDEDGDDVDFEKGEPSGSDSEWDDELDSSKKIIFDTKPIETHPVHAPFYPGEKYEWWWVTFIYNDKKNKMKTLASLPQLVKTLVDEETINIRFSAPPRKGIYNYLLSVRSDSYVDAEYIVDVKLNVDEPKVLEIKYDDLDEDDEEEKSISSEDEYTEDSSSDDE